MFDFDGTLVDTETPEYLVWQETFAAHGAAMPEGYWADLVGRGAEQEFERPAELLERLTGQPYGHDGARHARTMAMIHAAPLRPGVMALLDEAKASGFPCAVCSSSRHAWVDPALRARGVFERFAAIVCADDVTRAKPFPDLYLLVCARLGTEPSETVAFEDSRNGLAAAVAAGLFAVATPNPVTASMDLSAADLRIDDLAGWRLADLERAMVQRRERGRLPR